MKPEPPRIYLIKLIYYVRYYCNGVLTQHKKKKKPGRITKVTQKSSINLETDDDVSIFDFF